MTRDQALRKAREAARTELRQAKVWGEREAMKRAVHRFFAEIEDYQVMFGPEWIFGNLRPALWGEFDDRLDVEDWLLGLS